MDNSAPLTLWLLVNKHGATAEGEKNIGAKRLVSVPMWPQWSAREVQAALLEALHKGHIVPSCAHNIVRVRDAQGALVPLTPTTLKSTPVQPLLLDLCTAHHNGETLAFTVTDVLEAQTEARMTRRACRLPSGKLCKTSLLASNGSCRGWRRAWAVCRRGGRPWWRLSYTASRTLSPSCPVALTLLPPQTGSQALKSESSVSPGPPHTPCHHLPGFSPCDRVARSTSHSVPSSARLQSL
nr:uncharacterized protein LOC123762699 isoform X1 [Procambarus clarkii]